MHYGLGSHENNITMYKNVNPLFFCFWFRDEISSLLILILNWEQNMVLRWTIILKTDIKREVNVKWRVAKYATNTRNLCSAFNPSKCTHTVKHSHTVNTHPEQWAAILLRRPGAVGGSVPSQGSHLSRCIEGGERAGHSLPPPTIPAWPETRTRKL